MIEADRDEEAVFEAALQLRTPERAAYLDQACAGDPRLRHRTEALLGALERAGSLLNEPAVSRSEASELPSLPPTAKPGDRIGRYKPLQQIGKGGCGVVYMAEQEEPVRHRVALKVIKPGMDTKQVVARFEEELREPLESIGLFNPLHVGRPAVLRGSARHSVQPYFLA